MSGSEIRPLSWCESCRQMTEDVQQVLLGDDEPRPDWGRYACAPCRTRRRLTAVRREPKHKAVRTQ